MSAQVGVGIPILAPPATTPPSIAPISAASRAGPGLGSRWRGATLCASHHRVVPLEGYADHQGRICRDYRTTATIEGPEQEMYGTAWPAAGWELAWGELRVGAGQPLGTGGSCFGVPGCKR
jgi:hypothetical protein